MKRDGRGRGEGRSYDMVVGLCTTASRGWPSSSLCVGGVSKFFWFDFKGTRDGPSGVTASEPPTLTPVPPLYCLYRRYDLACKGNPWAQKEYAAMLTKMEKLRKTYKDAFDNEDVEQVGP